MVVASVKISAKKPASWAPDRQDVTWIDCNPEVGREKRDIHPFLVLSPRNFNERTSLVTGLPMTTVRQGWRQIVFRRKRFGSNYRVTQDDLLAR